LLELLEVEEDTLIHQEIMDGQVELETHPLQVPLKEPQVDQEVDQETMAEVVAEQILLDQEVVQVVLEELVDQVQQIQLQDLR
jgi:hypothetical protein